MDIVKELLTQPNIKVNIKNYDGYTVYYKAINECDLTITGNENELISVFKDYNNKQRKILSNDTTLNSIFIPDILNIITSYITYI